MKIRVTPKDLTIFIIFCIFLLYLCAVAVSNVTTLLNEGVFYGLFPIKAFTPKYIGPTFLLFIGTLVSIFLSVSSHIFGREKGIGLDLKEKEEKGYNRWATDKEMKSAKDVVKVKILDKESNAAGVALVNNGKEMWVDNGENHTLVVGATASGKTTAVVDPLVQSLAKAGESMVLTDPKGELYKNHSEMLKSRGYNIIVLNFRDPMMGNSWNPLALPNKLYQEKNTDKSIELLRDVAHNILYDGKSDDPFWQNSASEYFCALALGLFEDATEKEVNLNSINYMSTMGEQKIGVGNNDYIKEYFSLKGEASPEYVFASGTINSPNETKGSILSVFRQKLSIFSTGEQLSEMLSHSDFDLRDIGNKKTAVFMIIHDEKTTFHPLATIFIKQCYETLIDVAQKNGGVLPYRTNFILDEFANMPPLKDVTAMVTAARSRKIRFTFIIQNFAQLDEVYGKENSQTIRSNCGNLIYLLTTELAALEEISKLAGEVKSKEKEKTATRPLITVSDLQKMKLNEAIILKSRLNPFRTKLKPSYEIEWGEAFANGTLTEKTPEGFELFDIKEFVKTKKREKLFESIGELNGPRPFETNFFSKPPSKEELMERKDNPKEKEEKKVKEVKQNEELNPQNISTFNPLNVPVDEKLEHDVIDSLDENIDKEELKSKIDDIIKKLEQEEKVEKLDQTLYEKFDDFLKPETNKENNEPIINIDDDSIIVDSENVTDDQFYDDFFT